MNNDVENESYKGYEIRIVYDECSENPFIDWDGEGYIVFHSRADYSCNTHISYGEAKENKLAVPLSAYIHSGIALSILGEGYRCRWDTSDYIAYWLPDKCCKVKTKKQALEHARQACSLFNQWANGEVYGYVVEDARGEHIDSCYGFYGDLQEIIKEAKSIIDYEVNEFNKVKGDILAVS